MRPGTERHRQAGMAAMVTTPSRRGRVPVSARPLTGAAVAGLFAATFAIVLGGADGRCARGAGFDLDFFKPTTTSTGTFSEENGLTVPRSHLDVGMVSAYAHRPLVVENQKNAATMGDVVTDRTTSYFIAAYGITDELDVGLRAAAVVRQTGHTDVDIADNGGVPQIPRASAWGDTELWARLALVQVNRPDKRVRLTLLAPIGLPTGRPDALSGSGNISFRPRLIAGWHWERLSVSGSAGFTYTRAVEVPGSGLVVGKAVLAGAAAAYAMVPARLWLEAETSAALGMELSQTGIGSLATQAMGGARALLPGDIIVQLGLGTGLTRTAGSPRLSGTLTLARLWALP